MEKYEFYYQVVSLESANSEQLNLLEGKLQQLGEADEKKVEIYEQQLMELAKIITEKREILNKQLHEEEQLKKIRELVQKLLAAEEISSSLKKEESKCVEQSIAQYEACRFSFMHLFDRLNELEESKNKRFLEIEEDKQHLQAKEKEIERIKVLLKKIEPAYKERETLPERASDLEILLKMHQSELDIRNKMKRFQSGISYIDACEKQVERLNRDIEDVKQSIKSIRKERPNSAQLHAIKSWYGKKNDLEQQLADFDKWMNDIKEDGKKGERALAALLKQPLLRGLPKEADHAERKEWLIREQKRLKQLAEREAEEKHRMQVKRQLKKYADELRPGIPCSLYGSLSSS